jgi:hypothetical protein
MATKAPTAASSRTKNAQSSRASSDVGGAGTDKMKDYAPFPASRGAYGGGEEEGEEGNESEEPEPEDDASEEGESGDGEAGDEGESP